MCGKVNFTNMSRYSPLSERTYRRQYGQSFPYVAMNLVLIEQAIPAKVHQIAVMDCTFIPKSGKGTAGLDWFYNGSASRSIKGLELSVLAVVDVAAGRSYTLSVQQTPARAALPPGPAPSAIEFSAGETVVKGVSLNPSELALVSGKLAGLGYTTRLDGERLVVRAGSGV